MRVGECWDLQAWLSSRPPQIGAPPQGHFQLNFSPQTRSPQRPAPRARSPPSRVSAPAQALCSFTVSSPSKFLREPQARPQLQPLPQLGSEPRAPAQGASRCKCALPQLFPFPTPPEWLLWAGNAAGSASRPLEFVFPPRVPGAAEPRASARGARSHARRFAGRGSAGPAAGKGPVSRGGGHRGGRRGPGRGGGGDSFVCSPQYRARLPPLSALRTGRDGPRCGGARPRHRVGRTPGPDPQVRAEPSVVAAAGLCLQPCGRQERGSLAPGARPLHASQPPAPRPAARAIPAHSFDQLWGAVCRGGGPGAGQAGDP